MELLDLHEIDSDFGCETSPVRVFVVAPVQHDLADDVAVGIGGAAVEHRRRVGPLGGGGEGASLSALGEAGGPVIVAEYSESIG